MSKKKHRDYKEAPSILELGLDSNLTKADGPSPQIPTKEIGHTGLKEYSGVVYEEELRAIQSKSRWYKKIREMSENDATIGAVLFAIEMLIRQVPWTVQAGGEDPEDIEAQEFLESCLDDMSQSWADTLAEMLSFLTWGWSYHEIVYKYRQGDSDDPTKRSKYDDGRVGWRKMPVRAQETLDHWNFDDGGGVKSLVQLAPPTYQLYEIPIEKALLFRTSNYKGNPEGQSILRRCYKAWYFKDKIETYEAIGVERDASGIPVIYAPEAWTDSNAPAGQKAAFDNLKKIAITLKRDEQEGVVLPSIYDENGNQLVKLDLLSSSSNRVSQADKIISRYDQRIAMTVLADFILLGTKSVGSFALSSSKTELFATAIGAWLDMIAGVFNRHAIPRLFKLNGWSLEKLPKLVPGDIEKPNLEELGAFITALSGAGIDLTDGELQNYLREAAGFPLKSEEELKTEDEEARSAAEAAQQKPVEQLAQNAKQEETLVEAVKEMRDEIKKALA